MRLIFRFARSALVMLAVASGAMTFAPAGAQSVQSSLTLNGRTFNLSPTELARLGDLRQVLHTPNRAAQERAVAAARGVADRPDARYVLAVYQLEIARQWQDDALRAPALDVLIADPQTPRDRLISYLGIRGNIAFRNRDYPTASSLWTRLMELQPGDPQALNNLAQVRASGWAAARGLVPAMAVDRLQWAAGRAGRRRRPRADHRLSHAGELA
jgi:hypothetical protein